MNREQEIIEGCIEALKASRPFVSDGRGDPEDVERVVGQIDEALKRASDHENSAIR